MSYKKRDKGHWNQGKAYKGTRKAKEREYVKREIKQQIDEQDPSFRYPRYTHTPNKKAQLEHKIAWYQRHIDEYKKRDGFWKNWANWARDSLRKYRKQYAKLFGKEKKDQ